MGIVTLKLSDLPPLTPEEQERKRAFEEKMDGPPDYAAMAGWTAEERARSTRTSDYSSTKEAMDEAEHLADMQKKGMGVKELEAYKESRTKRLAAV